MENADQKPTLTPIAALEQVCNIGKFSCEGFVYEMDEDGMAACAEDLATGKFWQCSGDYEVAIDENTYWFSGN
jgi:hypothetical protein